MLRRNKMDGTGLGPGAQDGVGLPSLRSRQKEEAWGATEKLQGYVYIPNSEPSASPIKHSISATVEEKQNSSERSKANINLVAQGNDQEREMGQEEEDNNTIKIYTGNPDNVQHIQI